ncbi:hypothetical protein CUR178_05933 [Leishmania enriettii]|uniref:BRO1 domain-containing protein n=1 Tax=Leishmania enriettii TaxID=5663 RepID=A0A836GT03_LEIEN|nr:hypothetical protein CUR178_05933 [Leishmania enriettii]
MYAFLSSPASRTEPLDWVTLMTSALGVVREAPSEQILNTLTMMQSYATASPDVFTNVSRGSRDVKEYVALLCAMDAAVSEWPLRVRQLLDIPPVIFLPAGRRGGSFVTVPVHTPRGEALVFLFNVSLYHMDAALRYLARMRADASVMISSSASRRLGGGGSVAAPNQNAKLAAQHCRHAVDVLNWAETLHAAPGSPSALALRALRSHMPLDATRDMGTLCSAVAKYTYALSSASTKDKPDVLAKLAFDAAQLQLPGVVSASSSLQLLPSLLLATYHYHRATWYYSASRVPNMAEALGHMQYANTLLRTCDAQWGMEESHAEMEHESRQWWGRRLASLFAGARKMGASVARQQRVALLPRGDGGARGAAGAASPLMEADDDGSTLVASLQPVTEYPCLYELVLHGEGRLTSKASRSPAADGSDRASAASTAADVVQVYPYLPLLLQDVCCCLQRYQRENGLVYFTKATAADVVCRDVPDVAVIMGGGGATDAVEESVLFEPRASLFASLPSATTLQLALAQEEESGQAQQALARLLQRVERDRRQLLLFIEPPSALQHALDALEALLPQAAQWGALDAVVNAAAEAVEAAARDLIDVAAAWQEDHDAYVGTRCAEHPLLRNTRAELAVWSERASAALQRWKALKIPAEVDSRSAFLDALVPLSCELHAYLAHSEDVCRDARDALMSGARSVTLAQVQASTEAMDAVRQLGIEVLTRVAAAAPRRSAPRPPRCRPGHDTCALDSDADGCTRGVEEDECAPAPQYAEAEAVIEAMVRVLEEAPMVVTHVESAAAELRDMQKKTVVTPLSHLRDVRFLPSLTKRSSKEEAEREREGVDIARASAKSGGSAIKAADPTDRVTNAIPLGSASASSRKRTRTPSPEGRPLLPESPRDAASDSVSSSQLADAKEVSVVEVGGATTAAVSGSLLSRLKANKARRLQGPRDASTTASPSPVLPRTASSATAAATAKGKSAAKASRSKSSRR